MKSRTHAPKFRRKRQRRGGHEAYRMRVLRAAGKPAETMPVDIRAVQTTRKPCRHFMWRQRTDDLHLPHRSGKSMEREDKTMIPFLGDVDCLFQPDSKCQNDRFCDGCEKQPPDEEKPNGKNTPMRITWETGYHNTGLWPRCPACGEMPYGLERCVFCGQKFIQDDPFLQEYAKPPEEEPDERRRADNDS